LEPGWSEPVSLSQSFPQSYLPDIAADKAGNLYVVWDAQFTDRSEGWGDGVAFAMWDGEAWSPAVDLFGLELHHLPAIAADSQGRLHVIGVGQVGLGYSRAWAQQQPMDARLWSAPVDISDSLPRVYWNDIVVDSHDGIHVIFSDQAPDADRVIADGHCVGEDCSWVFYTRSTDGGDTWSTPVKISPRMASGGRVMIAVDDDDTLYVVWSTEMVARSGAFAPSANGFAYSLSGGLDWSEPETQLFDTNGVPGSLDDHPRDFWLSVAVDSTRMIHIISQGSGMNHLYREGVDGPWIDGGLPRPDMGDAGPGYGFRGVVVDGADALHFVLPAYQPPDASTAPGLFHAVWTKDAGWSNWARATTNTRGKGSGLGNVVMSGGNNLHVVWFEHLEGSEGHLFGIPRGRIEIYYAVLYTGAQAEPFSMLPVLPTEVLVIPANSTATATAAAPVTPMAESTAAPSVDTTRPQGLPVDGLIIGISLSVLTMVVVAGTVVLRRRR
jgi:hypothetical protein